MLHRVLVTSILLLVISTPVAWGDAPYHAWSTNIGGTGPDVAVDVGTDDYGNVYVLGYFNGTMIIGADTLVSAGGSDIFLAKFAPDGSPVWGEGFGGTSAVYANDMAVDGHGHIWVVGSFLGTIDLGGLSLVSVGSFDMFVARYNANGAHVWSKSYGSTTSDAATGVAIGFDGFTYVIGQFSGTVNIFPFVHNTVGGMDILLTGFDSSGAVGYSMSFGSTSDESPRDVEVDGDGNVTLVAYGYGSLDFGGGTLASIGDVDVYLAQFDQNWTHRWSRVVGGTLADYGLSLAVDGGNNLVVCGYYTGTSDFGGGPMTSTAGSYDTFLARYEQNGHHLMSVSVGDLGNQFSREVAVDTNDNIYIVGQYIGGADMGGGPLPQIGGYDAFIASYDSAGTHRWSRGFGGLLGDNASGIWVDPWGSVLMAGDFVDDIDCGGGLLLANGSSDAFVAKFFDGPTIHSVLDVPGDQGGVVNVAWYANSGDNAFDRAITEYSVWRAIDAGAAMSMVEDGATLIKDPSKVKSAAPDAGIIRAVAGNFWYEVGTVGAIALDSYSMPAPTLFDSTSVATDYQYFQVIAHTADPYVYYTSAPDSGYSVDNLAPAAPLNLAAKQVAPAELSLTWDPNTEPDIAHYAVYRGTDPAFVPDAGSLIATPTEPTVLDTGWQWDGGYWYKVVAVDTHGNTSPTALLGPDLVTGAADSPAVNRLEQNVPNPFNPSTTIAFTLREAGEVTLAVYDATGRRVRTLVSGRREARSYDVAWDGRDDAGTRVASGVYFYRLTAGSFTQTKKMVLLK